MPSLETNKIIMDPIHGYIHLTKLENKIIQLPLFNRLHDLRQMSMAYLVYPGAVVTRFQHSLGTMHLASKMVYQLLQSTKENEFLELFPKATSASIKFGIVQTVRLAALLHDLGHGPFSHVTEDISRAVLKEHYPSEFEQAQKLFGVKEPTRLPAHEYYSYKLVVNSEIKELVKEDELSKTSDGTIIPVDVQDVASIITKEETPRPDFCSPKALFILRKIISSQLDADRMDYLVRDAYATGVPYGLVDVDRVVTHMLVRQDRIKNYEVAVHERALGSVEDILDARFKMYKWLYGHHMVVATNELLLQAVGSLIDDKKLEEKEFYWNNFASGGLSDSHVMAAISREFGPGLNPYRGLFDRRYIPVSLLKRPSDHRRFQIEIGQIVGRDFGSDILRDKLRKFIDNIRQNPDINVDGNTVKVLAVAVPRSPYTPIRKEDTIWMCSEQKDELSELTTVSDYFAGINREWERSPSYYISYVVPGKAKEKASTLRENFRRNVASRIAAI